MKQRTLILWLDAVAYNNIDKKNTPYLWKLVNQKNWTFKPQQSSFGYSSIPASLVAGVTPNKHQQFAVFRRKEESESLPFWQASATLLPKKIVPYWYNLGRFITGEDFFLPAVKKAVADKVVPAQTKSYPQQGSLPVTTIFDFWRALNQSFVFYNWPLLVTNTSTKLTPLVAANDAARTRYILKYLDAEKPQHSFIHLWDLDAVGHAHSPDSPKFKSALQAYDDFAEQIIHRFDTKKDTIVLFADHGMTKVTNLVDPQEIVSWLEAETGVQVTWFADSTLLRLSSSKKIIVSKLEKFKKVGRVLTKTELSQLNLDKIAKYYFDELFVLKPGNAFVPTSFLSDHQVKGMHGYLHTDLKMSEWPMVAYNSKSSSTKKFVMTEEILAKANLW